eukprot:1160482-Pelagomonas_calceolata.AAC.14
MMLPHQRIRGKLMWVWWVSGSKRPQGTTFGDYQSSECPFESETAGGQAPAVLLDADGRQSGLKAEMGTKGSSQEYD